MLKNPIFGRYYEAGGCQFEIADDFSTVTIKSLDNPTAVVVVNTSSLADVIELMLDQRDDGVTPEVASQRLANLIGNRGEVGDWLDDDEIAQMPEAERPVRVNNCEARYDKDKRVWNLFNPWGRWLGHVALREQAVESLSWRTEYV